MDERTETKTESQKEVDKFTKNQSLTGINLKKITEADLIPDVRHFELWAAWCNKEKK